MFPNRRIAAGVFSLSAIVMAGCTAETAKVLGPDDASVAPVQTGNGAPSGAHYTLNIIGVSKDKNPNMTGGNGHRIFVPLEGTTKIWLCESGEDAGCLSTGADQFEVIDANGTDGSATFALPAADTFIRDHDITNDCTAIGDLDADGDIEYRCGSGVTTYSVFVRALGGRGGSATMTTCGWLDDNNNGQFDTGEEVCSAAELQLDADSRPSRFQNATGYLLYLFDVDIDGDGDIDYKRIPLFSSVLEGYFWDYDNDGLRLAQLRFYNCSSTVGDTPDITATTCFD